MKDLKHYLKKIYNEDERNLLPKDFDDFIKDNYGSFEDFIDAEGYNKYENLKDFYKDQLAEELGEDADEDEIDQRSDELALKDLQDEAEETFYSCIDLYRRLGNPLTLYRSVSLPAKNFDDLENLKDEFERMDFGVYWAYDYDGAVSHWGNMAKTQDYIFKAHVSSDQVNWKDTLEANMNPETGDEKEIRLYDGAIINLVSIKDKKSKKIQEINMRVKA